MNPVWDATLATYIQQVVSPDGRDTFESTPALAGAIIKAAHIKGDDTVIDIGSGWGNITRACSSQTNGPVIGIEPEVRNIEEAERLSRDDGIVYIQGSFELPGYSKKADIVVSSLTFHQVLHRHRIQALQNVKELMLETGRFILCDVILLFDVKGKPEEFNRVYRYLLERTVPAGIYQEHILPQLQDDHLYTWEEMKEHTPEDHWFSSLEDLEYWTGECGLRITEKRALCPFFGILTIEHSEQSDHLV